MSEQTVGTITFQVQQRCGKFRHRHYTTDPKHPTSWSPWREMEADCAAITAEGRGHNYHVEYEGDGWKGRRGFRTSA